MPARPTHATAFPPSSAQPGSFRWRIVALLMALCFISHVNRVGMSIAGNERIMEQFGFSPTQMSGVMGASEGPFWSTAVELGRRRGGMAAAIMNTGGNAGGMLAPVLTPWVSAHFGWPVGIALGAFVCLLGAACWAWIKLDALNRSEPAT